MPRIFLAIVLCPVVLWASIVGLFLFGSGLDGLDGRSSWDGRCLYPDPRGHGVLVAGSTAALAGMWAAYVGWLLRRWWWRAGVAAIGGAVLLFGVAAGIETWAGAPEPAPTGTDCSSW